MLLKHSGGGSLWKILIVIPKLLLIPIIFVRHYDRLLLGNTLLWMICLWAVWLNAHLLHDLVDELLLVPRQLLLLLWGLLHTVLELLLLLKWLELHLLLSVHKVAILVRRKHVLWLLMIATLLMEHILRWLSHRLR